MFHTNSARQQSNGFAALVLVITLAVAGWVLGRSLGEINSDDCVSVTETLANGSTQAIQTCS